MNAEPTPLELFELDIDTHLTSLWAETNTVGKWNLGLAAAYMRAAFGIGYVAALTEGGSLLADHGYRLPERRVA